MTGLANITLMTLIPLAGAIGLAIVRPKSLGLSRGLALGFSLAAAIPALWIWQHFDSNLGTLQEVERHTWIPTLGIEYFVGVDGLSLMMILLTSLLVPMSILTSWHRKEHGSGYLALVLFLQAGLYGTFTALNFFHWFLFWELSLIPAYFLVRQFGNDDAKPAALQFFLYTMAGSIAMLVAFMAIKATTGSLDFIELAAQASGTGSVGSLLIFLGVLFGLAVKVPLMPLHAWLPSTYGNAPTGTTMLLTGVMSKMGVYGFLRILLPLFPAHVQAFNTLLLALAVATIVFSALAALKQTDLKRIFAYSSVNHLGYCLLAIFAVAASTEGSGPADADWVSERAAALNGVLLQMFNHGITAAALFACVAFLEDRSGGKHGLVDFGGLRKVAPIFCALAGIASFSSLGLPGLNGFTGEFLIFKGTFALVPWAAVLATPGLLITALFLLRFLQGVFDGPLSDSFANLKDLDFVERVVLIPVTVLMFAIGICPQFVVELTNRTVLHLVKGLGI